jgi:pyrroline-5-carboxylate reductase
MEQVAIAEGFSNADAHALVLQTLKGAVAYLEHGGEKFAELRARVTSPNGTTAAALQVLSESLSDEHVRAAVRAALDRSRTLGSIARCTSAPS